MGTVKAGAARTNITPNLGTHLVGYFEDRTAEVIHDDLYCRAIALTDGKTTLGLVTCDLIAIPAPIVEAAKERIAEQTGIPREHVLISATHTHTGPSAMGALGTPDEPEYAQSLIPRIADAVCMATRAMVPAEVAWTTGNCAEEVHNRRWHMKDGTVKMNPGYQNPDAIKPAGPTDPELGLLVIRERESRAPIAVYANLALHYVGNQAPNAVSADYFGVFEKVLQRAANSDFVVVMANGCQGDINNCDFSQPARRPVHAYSAMERVANFVGAEAWKQWQLLREEDFRSDLELSGTLREVPFKRRTATAEEMAIAEELCRTGEDHTDSEWVYAHELVQLNDMPLEWNVPVHALRIGDLGVVGLHGEVFVEIGLDIKARSQFGQTMVVGLANGAVGYIATDKALDEGSYETRLCRHVCAPKGTAKLWADTGGELLRVVGGGA